MCVATLPGIRHLRPTSLSTPILVIRVCVVFTQVGTTRTQTTSSPFWSKSVRRGMVPKRHRRSVSRLGSAFTPTTLHLDDGRRPMHIESMEAQLVPPMGFIFERVTYKWKNFVSVAPNNA
jgi:hypothetical protein